MSTSPNLALRFSPVDKAALVELAERLSLNQTDVVRLLVREKLAILQGHDGRVYQEPLITIRPVDSPVGSR